MAGRAGGVPAGVRPAYSPDLDPIEEALGKVKTALRAAGARTRAGLDAAIAAALEAATPADATGWFVHCGYPPVAATGQPS